MKNLNDFNLGKDPPPFVRLIKNDSPELKQYLSEQEKNGSIKHSSGCRDDNPPYPFTIGW